MIPFLSQPTSKQVVDWILESVAVTVGGNLHSLILFGNHADSAETPIGIGGPLQILIVLDKVDLPVLQELRDVFAQSRLSQSVSPMILSADDLRSSADVFPITYMEMKRRHILLSGKDVLADIEIRQDHLRLRCEQELKNLSLRLQSALLTRGTRPTQLLEAMRRGYSAYSRAVRATLVLMDGDENVSDDDLPKIAEAQFQLKAGVLARVAELCAASERGNEVVSAAFQEFLLVVNQTAAHVDALPSGVTVLTTLDDGE